MSEWFVYGRVRRTRATRVVDLRAGNVAKVVGVAGAEGEPLEAPFSGTPCVAFRVTAFELPPSRTARPSHARSQVLFGDTFWIDDESGRARVRLHGRAVLLAPEERWTRGKPDTEQSVERFRARHGDAKSAFIEPDNEHYWYYEEVIPVGAWDAVMGRIGFEPDASAPDPHASMRTAPGYGVVEPDEAPLVISVRTRDTKR